MIDLRLEYLRGEQIKERLHPLAALRIAVFRDWPYLYNGSFEYEAHYLESYIRSPQSLIVLAWDVDECVGATTVLPLAEAESEWQRPFIEKGFDLSKIDYFGESMLRKPYRGRGYGVQFFKVREAHAHELKLPICVFAAVERPGNHPAKPADYVPYDTFWTHRGYYKMTDMVTAFSWPDIGTNESTQKLMTFWMRELPTDASISA